MSARRPPRATWEPATDTPGGLWRDRAACRDHDPEMFDPDPRDLDSIAEAKAVCLRCPVMGVCLTAALAEEGGVDVSGRATIRGAYTATERAAIQRRRQRRAAA